MVIKNELEKLIKKSEKSGLDLMECHLLIKLIVPELKLYRQALTKAVSLPKGQLPEGQLPDGKEYFTVMLNGNCYVFV